jgi:hypothetical protein
MLNTPNQAITARFPAGASAREDGTDLGYGVSVASLFIAAVVLQ